MSDIFLSYANEDKEDIAALAAALKTHGWSVFWDRDVPAGESWRDYINVNLTEAHCVVVAWSEASILSRWVIEEADESLKREIPLVPVLVEAVTPPMGFRSIQAVDLVDCRYNDSSPAFRKLVKDIGEILKGRTADEQSAPTEVATVWASMPFRPVPLANVPADEYEIPPAFRVGPTEALSPRISGLEMEDKGAAGTMAFPVPPSVSHITGFRVAGSVNDGEVLVQLVMGGWDPKHERHVRTELVSERITSSPFYETYQVGHIQIDAGHTTLSVYMRGTRRTSVSLVAIEFVLL